MWLERFVYSSDAFHLDGICVASDGICRLHWVEIVAREQTNQNRTQREAPRVRVENLSFSYNETANALRGVNLDCSGSKIVGILGPNGSGKSTTFKILSTQLKPQGGEAYVCETSIRQNPAAVRQMLGVTFQSPSLDPWLTVEENMFIQAAMVGLSGSDARTRVTELIEAFELTEKRTARVKTLSGGLSRRVELAKTLLASPPVLLLDEPTTGVDPSLRLAFWSEIKKLRASGVLIVVTTHLMDEADLCDELFFLSGGQVVGHGKPQELKEQLGFEVVVAEHRGPDDEVLDENALRAMLGLLVVDLQIEGQKLTVRTRDPKSTMDVISKNWGDDLKRIEWSRPSLAEVYLKLTQGKDRL